jgi:hypothetical protein
VYSCTYFIIIIKKEREYRLEKQKKIFRCCNVMRGHESKFNLSELFLNENWCTTFAVIDLFVVLGVPVVKEKKINAC